MQKPNKHITLYSKLLFNCIALAAVLFLVAEVLLPLLNNEFLKNLGSFLSIVLIISTIVTLAAAVLLLAQYLYFLLPKKIVERPLKKQAMGVIAVFGCYFVLNILLSIISGLYAGFLGFNAIVSFVLTLASYPFLLNALYVFGSGSAPLSDALKTSVKTLRTRYIPLFIFGLLYRLVIWLIALFPIFLAWPLLVVLGVVILYFAVEWVPKFLK